MRMIECYLNSISKKIFVLILTSNRTISDKDYHICESFCQHSRQTYRSTCYSILNEKSIDWLITSMMIRALSLSRKSFFETFFRLLSPIWSKWKSWHSLVHQSSTLPWIAVGSVFFAAVDRRNVRGKPSVYLPCASPTENRRLAQL